MKLNKQKLSLCIVYCIMYVYMYVYMHLHVMVCKEVGMCVQGIMIKAYF
jgi:hypothetical protein